MVILRERLRERSKTGRRGTKNTELGGNRKAAARYYLRNLPRTQRRRRTRANSEDLALSNWEGEVSLAGAMVT